MRIGRVGKRRGLFKVDGVAVRKHTRFALPIVGLSIGGRPIDSRPAKSLSWTQFSCDLGYACGNCEGEGAGTKRNSREYPDCTVPMLEQSSVARKI